MAKLLILTMAVLMSMAGRAQADPITITNPGFETGNFSGWTKTEGLGSSAIVFINFPHSGTYAAEFGGGGVGSYAEISQTLTTTPGDLVDVMFWLRNDNASSITANDFQALKWRSGVRPAQYSQLSLHARVLYRAGDEQFLHVGVPSV